MKKNLNIIVFCILAVSACRNEPVKLPESDPVRVKVTGIKTAQSMVPVHSAGIVMPGDEMKLSFKTGGIIAEISAREGDQVKKGDLLASLNLSEINANVQMAENAYEKALRDWTRARNLYNDTVASLEQFQNATTALEVAKSNLSIARFNMDHSVIRAPADGIILKQLSKAGEMIAPGYPVFLFGALGNDRWKVRTSLSDRDIVRINKGDSARVTLDAYPGIYFSCKVVQISAMTDPVSGTCEVELSLNPGKFRLTAGFIAGVDIFPSRQDTGYIVPVGAIVGIDGNAGFIFTVNDSDYVRKTGIEILSVSGQQAIVKNIPEGVNRIVSEGTAYLKDGEKVRIVK
ncbi:MAG: efflux RND transporter periplasmic adaptor subunit [Bacteroidales bacterium]|nr:efflux RND transporter periplasmic adaptor subunit [Bacteroidales bacterium]